MLRSSEIKPLFVDLSHTVLFHSCVVLPACSCCAPACCAPACCAPALLCLLPLFSFSFPTVDRILFYLLYLFASLRSLFPFTFLSFCFARSTLVRVGLLSLSFIPHVLCMCVCVFVLFNVSTVLPPPPL